ncbi:26551_t:CDS:2, partial [Racocetra persica]
MSKAAQDIYNAHKKLYQEYLQRRIPIQALLDNLKEGLFEYDFMYDSENYITHLFFSHNKSIELTQNKEDYEYALIQKSRLFNRIDKSKVIITDHELALVNALEKVFSESKNYFYQ